MALITLFDNIHYIIYMSDKQFTAELKRLFKNIKEEIVKDYPIISITIEYFLLSAIDDEKCVANQMIDSVMLSEAKSAIRTQLLSIIKSNSVNDAYDSINDTSVPNKPKYNADYDACISYSIDTLLQSSEEKINSGHMLISSLSVNDNINRLFMDMGVNSEQLIDALSSVTERGKKGSKKSKPSQSKKNTLADVGVTEKTLINLNDKALECRIPEIIDNDEVIDNIFRVFAKCERNNIVLTGKSGVGKTDTVKHIANLLVRNEVPKMFKHHKLMQIDFPSLASSFQVRGAFEALFKSIVEDASKRNCYIFFIDDIHTILSDKARFTDMNIESTIDMVLSDPNIYFICTSSDEGYSSTIQSNGFFKRRFQRITLNEKTEDEAINILNICKWKYELYHNVTYNDDAVETCVKSVKKYIPDSVLPDTAFDILDSAGAEKALNEPEDARITELEHELEQINIDIAKAQYDHDDIKYDELVTKEVKLKSKLNEITKEDNFGKIPQIVTSDDILNAVSIKANIPVSKMSSDERKILSELEYRIGSMVIGQDEAVSEVVKTVKRQRVGISKHGKPSVMMFIGSSGTGKTFLAKTLASEVFGDDSAFVRLDMSEYSDKTSVNKITGSSPGYIGYDKGGILTEAIKKRSHCVLLLDEMEKADDSVFDVFLQLFDDGRLTDNKGITVDFSNVIVIMTSNVGAQEANLRSGGVGFLKSESMAEDIMKKELRKRFKPEFINRIDNIIMFNKLDDKALKRIIGNEIDNLIVRLSDMGFGVEGDFREHAIAHVYTLLKKENESGDYGARPILRLIRKEIEDRITDFIIEKSPEDGYVFSFSDISY